MINIENEKFTAAEARNMTEEAISFNHIISSIKEATRQGKGGTSLKIFKEEHIVELEKRDFLVGKTVDPHIYNVFWNYNNKQKHLIKQNNENR